MKRVEQLLDYMHTNPNTVIRFRASDMILKLQAKIIRIILSELGHLQSPTPIHVNNTTAVGIVNNTIKRQHSRSMEMRYFCLLDQEAQKYMDVQHPPGQETMGDYPIQAPYWQGAFTRPALLHPHAELTDPSPQGRNAKFTTRVC